MLNPNHRDNQPSKPSKGSIVSPQRRRPMPVYPRMAVGPPTYPNSLTNPVSDLYIRRPRRLPLTLLGEMIRLGSDGCGHFLIRRRKWAGSLPLLLLLSRRSQDESVSVSLTI